MTTIDSLRNELWCVTEIKYSDLMFPGDTPSAADNIMIYTKLL